MSLLTAQLVPLLVVLLLGCFGAMAFAIHHFFRRSLMQTMRRLQQQEADNEKVRQQLATQLVAATKEAKDIALKAQAEAEQARSQAKQEAEASRQAAIAHARQEAERILDQAMRSRNALVHEVAVFTAGEVTKRAHELVGAIFTGALGESLHRAWAAQVLANGLLSMERLATREQVREALVRTAYALTDEQRATLRQRVHAVLGHEIAWREEVDAKLLAGFVITLGHMVIDGSLASKLLDLVRDADHAGEA